MLSEEKRKEMLELPSKPVQIVLDTDTKNEIDDQFAIVYTLLSFEGIELEALTAAPFTKNLEIFQRLGADRAPRDVYPNPAVGMEASYQEILTVLDKMGMTDKIPVYRGSTASMTSPDEPVRSEAAEKIIELALQKRKQPLYVVAIGAITNVTSALLMEPKIKEHIVVEWLGGHPTHWEHAKEFNLVNDPIAAMALFDSGVPLVWVPCKNVAEHLRTVPAEMEQYVRGRGSIGDYLADLVKNYVPGEARSKVLWDIANIAYLLNPEWVPTKLFPTPKLNVDTLTWDETGPNRHLCRTSINLHRDPILLDFFQKLDKFAKGELILK